ncbi:MAG TPA: TPM domain-containing protein [Polyangia bacterium]|nr:TPM domain-containing protein [Polyangia bacterium]
MAGALDKIIHPADQQKIVDAIRSAERVTSGEVKVHVEMRCPGGDPYKRAADLFARLGLTKTKDRNAVLIYVATRDRKFAILGDKGIHEEVGSAFWAEAVQRMKVSFARGAFGEGISGAVQSVGQRMAAKFPRRADDVNEIDNEITTDET